MKQPINLFSLNIEKVTKKFEKITAVDDLSFTAKQGDIIALLGPNGAGKSTLMNMIAGYLTPDSGRILVKDKDVAKDDLLTKGELGFLPEGAPMYGDMTVRLFLKYLIELKTKPNNKITANSQSFQQSCQNELIRIMEIAKIADVAEQKIETLSKGYLRRVGFAQSIIWDPNILLLDEPTDGLDPNQKDHMRKLIKDMGKNKTIIISTHLLDEAETVANRIILINKGKIIIDGSLKTILSQTKKTSLEEAFRKLTNATEE